jgi:transcriptional regulator with XRE-family HTH domain
MADLLHFMAMGDFPNRVNQLRRERGLTQQELADAVGCSKMQVSGIERGKREFSYSMMQRFAKAEQLRKAGRHGEAETELAEGMRQTTKQWKNQIEKRRIAAHGKLDPDTRVLPPDARLQKAIDIMNEVGDGKLSPAQAESQLKEVGYTPTDVAHDVGKQLEMLQKLFPG